MRAATYDRPGDPSVVRVREVATPEPGPGDVRVRMAVAGVNPTDWKTLATSGPARDLAVPCQDGAGTIDAVGEGVDSARVGERVWLLLAAHSHGWGTAAQYSVVPTDRAIPLPDSASFELGASLGVPALTASHCLRSGGGVDGLSVLVSGGAGAVGQMAVQLARFDGAAPVVATVSGDEKGRIAAAAGAECVVDYRQPGAAGRIRDAAPNGIDRFVEVALDANIGLDLAVAAEHALICCYAADPDAAATLPVRELMSRNIALRFMLLYTVRPAALAAAVAHVRAAVAAGALQTLPRRRYPLAQAAAALAAVKAGTVGKVLIDLP